MTDRSGLVRKSELLGERREKASKRVGRRSSALVVFRGLIPFYKRSGRQNEKELDRKEL